MDHIRGLTVYSSNETAAPKLTNVSLCPGARVYSYCICAVVIDSETPWPPEVPVAVLHLQDSSILVFNECCGPCVNLPGLKWPAYAKFEVAPGVRASLTLTYGNCA